MSDPVLQVSDLSVHAADRRLLRNTAFRVNAGQVFGIIGPSGGGKSTLLRCLNRLVELTPGLRASGTILLHGESVHSMDANVLRARVGMLFQQPVIFPGSIRDNVLFGAKRLRSISRAEQDALLESALGEAALWEEARDRLAQSATVLSVGQQQRLCLARALAVQPEVLLMDEPTSALDPRSTAVIEELVARLKGNRAIVIATHNIPQARRIADWIAFIAPRDGAGEIIEQGGRDQMLSSPRTPELIEYLRHCA